MNNVQQTILWRRLDLPGLDACYYGRTSAGWRICGAAIFQLEDTPCHIGYAINAQADWTLQSVHVFGTRGRRGIDASIAPSADGAWSLNGALQPGTDGCTDVDLGFTSAGLLATLRRLTLPVGGETSVRVARLLLPDPALAPAAYRFVRLNRASLLVSSSGSAVSTIFSVDEDLAVLSYPGRWEQLCRAHGDRRPAPHELDETCSPANHAGDLLHTL
jgi:hypothetical protein